MSIKNSISLFLITLFWLPACNTQTNNEAAKNNKMENAHYSELMDIRQFWDIIEISRKKNLQRNEQINFLETSLTKLSEKEIAGFRLQTDKLLFDSYTSELWCAAYVINGGCSDDGFQYFRCWLISMGEKAYTESINKPDNLIEYASVNDYENEFEEFCHVAYNAFYSKTKKDLYEAIDTGFHYSENKYQPIKFTWEEDKPETMKKICPELFKKFWK